MKVVFIVNPRSAGGATGKAFEQVEGCAREVFGEIDVQHTERPRHAIELAAQLGASCDLLVSVGGDGTANEVVNGLAELEGRDRPVLGVLPAGTGCDLVKSLGMPPDLEEAVRFLAVGERIEADWMRLEMESEGHKVSRVCINVAGFGMNGDVVRRVNQSSKRLGGRVSFALATVRSAMRWRAPEVSIEWEGPDGPGRWSGPLASAFVANGGYCGGGMWVGRGGSLTDGAAELTILPDLPLRRAPSVLARLYRGTLGEIEGVITARVSEIRASSVRRAIPVDVDGEQPGDLPLSLCVEHHALRLVASSGG